jgi:hypothetical protein
MMTIHTTTVMSTHACSHKIDLLAYHHLGQTLLTKIKFQQNFKGTFFSQQSLPLCASISMSLIMASISQHL